MSHKPIPIRWQECAHALEGGALVVHDPIRCDVIRDMMGQKHGSGPNKRNYVEGVRPWFKVTVSVIDLEGPSAYWSQHLCSLSSATQNKIIKKFKKL